MVALAVLGALFQLLGILALAAPDVVPGLVRLGAWLTPRRERLVRRLRRLFHRSASVTIHGVTAAGEANAAGSIEAETIVDPNATLEQKVAFLIAREKEAQRDISALAKKVDALEREEPRRLSELRKEMKAHVTHELASSEAAYRTLRLLGSFALLVGLVLSTAALFVG